MPYPSSSPAESHTAPTAKLPLPSDVVLSLLMPPLLLTLVGERLGARLLQDVGQLSEQLYQGVRLPTLTVPPAPPPV